MGVSLDSANLNLDSSILSLFPFLSTFHGQAAIITIFIASVLLP